MEFGKAYLFPLVPAHRSTVAMLAAKPTHIVETSGLIKFIVSKIANPELITPPGELIYILISLSGSSLSRYRSWATNKFATWSFIGVPRNIILSFNNREYMSKALSPLVPLSITIGIIFLGLLIIFKLLIF